MSFYSAVEILERDAFRGLSDTPGMSAHGEVEVLFRGWKARLIQEIGNYDVVLGCVAWLRDPDILDALADKETLILMTKDTGWKGRTPWAEQVKRSYRELKPFDWENSTGTGLEEVVRPYWVPLSAVYCVGQTGSGFSGAPPAIMHNKFWIFCNRERGGRLSPKLVISGSANGTTNSSKNLENVIIMKDMAICRAYLKEMQNILYLAENLNWSSRDVNQSFYSNKCERRKFRTLASAHEAFFESNVFMKNLGNPYGVSYQTLRRVFQRFLRLHAANIRGFSTILCMQYDTDFKRISAYFCDACGKRASPKCCSVKKKTTSKRLCITNVSIRDYLGIKPVLLKRKRHNKKRIKSEK